MKYLSYSKSQVYCENLLKKKKKFEYGLNYYPEQSFRIAENPLWTDRVTLHSDNTEILNSMTSLQASTISPTVLFRLSRGLLSEAQPLLPTAGHLLTTVPMKSSTFIYFVIHFYFSSVF